jgi:CheY-like chemotaxis protein
MGLISFFTSKKKLNDLPLDIPIAELKKRTKIVVVDDEEESFPYKLLQNDGYTIEWWEKVDSPKLQRLENGDFDIIVLDIMGVVDKEISKDDGIGVLKRIKNVNQHQLIVAFSGQSYDLSKTEFWKLADDTLSKPVTFIQCKEVLDNLIKTKINILNYWRAIKAILTTSGMAQKNISSLENELVMILDGSSKFNEDLILKKFLGGVQNSAAIITLIQAILRIWS